MRWLQNSRILAELHSAKGEALAHGLTTGWIFRPRVVPQELGKPLLRLAPRVRIDGTQGRRRPSPLPCPRRLFRFSLVAGTFDRFVH